MRRFGLCTGTDLTHCPRTVPAAFVFTVYNPNVNLFLYSRYSATITPAGRFTTESINKPLRIDMFALCVELVRPRRPPPA